MNRFIKLLTSVLFFLSLAFSSIAQTASDRVEMDDALLASGKIYVVVTVLSLVFIGLFIFLISIDRKVSRLEKEMQNKK